MIKEVKGYEGLYTIDEKGNVFSIRNNKNIKHIKLKSGYVYVHLCKNGTGQLVRLHRLVAQHFIPNPNGYKQVNHKNGIKTDNEVSNLEWCNGFYNMQHAIKTGLFVTSGESNPSAKLTKEQVEAIRTEYVRNSKTHGTTALAKKYNVSNVMIGKIVRNECWKEG